MKGKMAVFISLLLIVVALTGCLKSEAAKEVDEMISQLGEITLESEEAIQEAEEAAEKLEEKDYKQLDNLEVLEQAKSTYQQLAAEEKARPVAAEIDKISDQKNYRHIQNVRKKYESLTDYEKQFVDNYDVLTGLEQAAEEDLSSLSQQMTVLVDSGDYTGAMDFWNNNNHYKFKPEDAGSAKNPYFYAEIQTLSTGKEYYTAKEIKSLHNAAENLDDDYKDAKTYKDLISEIYDRAFDTYTDRSTILGDGYGGYFGVFYEFKFKTSGCDFSIRYYDGPTTLDVVTSGNSDGNVTNITYETHYFIHDWVLTECELYYSGKLEETMAWNEDGSIYDKDHPILVYY